MNLHPTPRCVANRFASPGLRRIAAVLASSLLLASGCATSRDAPPSTSPLAPKTSDESDSPSFSPPAPQATPEEPMTPARRDDVILKGEPAAGEWAQRAGAAAPARAGAPSVVALGKGLEVDLARREVRLRAQTALDEGWLEQAVCLAGTREHESLLVVETPPRLLHAALLMLDLEPGRPGSWSLEADGVSVRREPPFGAALELFVRFEADGERREVPLASWVETPEGASLPAHPWVFAGSRLDRARDGGELYAADFAGSVAGLVTFGDEVIAFEEVRSDRVEVEEAGFLVRRGAPPPPGRDVVLVIRGRRAP